MIVSWRRGLILIQLLSTAVLASGFQWLWLVGTSGAVPLEVLQERVEEFVRKGGDETSLSDLSEVNDFTTLGSGQFVAFMGTGVSLEQGITSQVQNDDFVATMTFANWCKCCVVPGACQV